MVHLNKMEIETYYNWKTTVVTWSQKEQKRKAKKKKKKNQLRMPQLQSNLNTSKGAKWYSNELKKITTHAHFNNSITYRLLETAISTTTSFRYCYSGQKRVKRSDPFNWTWIPNNCWNFIASVRKCSSSNQPTNFLEFLVELNYLLVNWKAHCVCFISHLFVTDCTLVLQLL